jgi:hypothetical protein
MEFESQTDGFLTRTKTKHFITSPSRKQRVFPFATPSEQEAHHSPERSAKPVTLFWLASNITLTSIDLRVRGCGRVGWSVQQIRVGFGDEDVEPLC